MNSIICSLSLSPKQSQEHGQPLKIFKNISPLFFLSFSSVVIPRGLSILSHPTHLDKLRKCFGLVVEVEVRWTARGQAASLLPVQKKKKLLQENVNGSFLLHFILPRRLCRYGR
ncbi:hypothetical protein CDAR_207561 [Caerostris darwini]|uniref:Uncharacterized protein n=1 Tax=Caerostris darwini TaxID=1538125 RepID=A0AAV4VHM8_9ARAC|nr:hypothetical protein CDAR_207561 [Caerostris darwini]